MKILELFRKLFHPRIVAEFNDLRRNHRKALECWIEDRYQLFAPNAYVFPEWKENVINHDLSENSYVPYFKLPHTPLKLAIRNIMTRKELTLFFEYYIRRVNGALSLLLRTPSKLPPKSDCNNIHLEPTDNDSCKNTCIHILYTNDFPFPRTGYIINMNDNVIYCYYFNEKLSSPNLIKLLRQIDGLDKFCTHKVAWNLESQRVDTLVKDVKRYYDIDFTNKQYMKFWLALNKPYDIDNTSIRDMKYCLYHKKEILRLYEIYSYYEKSCEMSVAKDLALRCPKTYKELFNFPLEDLTQDQAKQIAEKGDVLIDKEEYPIRIKQAVSNWDRLNDVPFFFWFYYLPKQFTKVDRFSDAARHMIWDFKDGHRNNMVRTLVQHMLEDTFTREDLKRLTFVCIPASNDYSNRNRYESFSSILCDNLGMRNAFTHITITKGKTQSHLGGTDAAEYDFDQSFFRDSRVVLFDDVVTRGRTMNDFKERLIKLGATIVCALSIGKTCSDGDYPFHPYNRLSKKHKVIDGYFNYYVSGKLKYLYIP